MALGLYAEAVNDCHNAISKDAEYSRAYLRRARAFRAMNKFNDSVRDYRRYLCFDPIPGDFKEIQKELDEMIDNKAKEEKGYTSSQKQSSSSANANRPQSGKKSSSSSSSSRTNPNNSSSNTRTSNSRTTRDAFGNDFDPFSGGVPGAGSYNSYFSPNNNDYSNFYYAELPKPSSSSSHNKHQHQHHHTHSNKAHYHNNTYNSNSYDKYFSYNSDEDDSDNNPQNHTHNHTAGSSSHQRPASSSSKTSSTPSSSNTNKGLFSLSETDHYTILGVDTAASDREIKLSYRKLALQFHPDKNKEDHAEDRFKMIALAYNILTDKVGGVLLYFLCISLISFVSVFLSLS
jgi:tetratricopeptide (TPR) repeat protein